MNKELLKKIGIYAGIVLDTKNFIMRTGVRTFEAAAVLRRLGADTVEVKKLLQSDFCETLQFLLLCLYRRF
mgnify:CR=1 FL=1